MNITVEKLIVLFCKKYIIKKEGKLTIDNYQQYFGEVYKYYLAYVYEIWLKTR